MYTLSTGLLTFTALTPTLVIEETRRLVSRDSSMPELVPRVTRSASQSKQVLVDIDPQF